MKVNTRNIFLYLCTGLLGCGMELATQQDISEAEQGGAGNGEVTVTVQPILNGTPVSGKRGVIALGTGTGNNFNRRCTGVLISPKYLLTAAHCVMTKGSGSSFVALWRTVRYYDPSGTPRELTTVNEELRARAIETYDGISDPDAVDCQDDLAVVWRHSGASWTNTSTSDYQRIWFGSIATVDTNTFYGTGWPEPVNAGLNSMPINIHDSSQYWFKDLAGSRRICHGDSGGPYIDTVPNGASNVQAVVGIFSSAEGLADNDCAVSGGEQCAARLSINRIAWLNDKNRFPNMNCTPANSIATCF